jgi:hypothetical protein
MSKREKIAEALLCQANAVDFTIGGPTEDTEILRRAAALLTSQPKDVGEAADLVRALHLVRAIGVNAEGNAFIRDRATEAEREIRAALTRHPTKEAENV